MAKMLPYFAVALLCAGCSTTHQINDFAPHATVLFVTRDARFSGLRDMSFDGKMVPLQGSVAGPFRITPGGHTLILERQVWVKENHPVGYWLSLAAILLGPSTLQHGQVDWSGSSGEYSNFVEKIQFTANVGVFYLMDCRQFDGALEPHESWMALESKVITRYGCSVSDLK